MGKRTNKLIPFLSQSKSLDSSKLNNNNNNDSSNYSSSPPWLFPTCGGNIKTLSFRETSNNFYKDDNFKTFNSAFLETSDSLFTVSSSSRRSFSTLSDDFCLLAAAGSTDPIDNDSLIRGLRSDRLFFEPDLTCSLLLQQKQQPEKNKPVPVPVPVPMVYKESEAMCMESQNPCEDFRRSMEEMVEAHGLKDWQGLEELLECYLNINAKFNHAYIIAAFIDLLVNLSFISSSSTTTTTTTTSTSNTNSHNNTSTSITTTSTSSSSSLLSNNNNNIINNNCSLSSPSSPLSLPSSSLTTPSLSSLFDLGDDHCNHDNDDVR